MGYLARMQTYDYNTNEIKMTLSRVELSVDVFCGSFWAHSVAHSTLQLSVSGFAAGGPNMDLYMTYLTKIL